MENDSNMPFVDHFDPQDAESRAPIAVFDSGVGGISILKKLYEVLPHENYWYYGDSANAPYGTKSTNDIQRLTCGHIDRMVQAGAKAVVIACNTATSAAATKLRQQYPHIPIIGMEPEIKTPALNNHKRILVMATPMTLQLEKFHSLFDQYKDKAEFHLQPCPGLAELIEQGVYAAETIKEYLKNTLSQYINEPVDAVVLGCTHYLHIKHLVKDVLGEQITFYDGAAGAARELNRKLAERNLLNTSDQPGAILIENSGKNADIIELCRNLLRM